MRTLDKLNHPLPSNRTELAEAAAVYYNKKAEAFGDFLELIRAPARYIAEAFRGQRK